MANFIRMVTGQEKIEVIPLESESTGVLPENQFFDLNISNRAHARLEFLDIYTPSVALHLPDVFVWSGTRIYRQRVERDSTPQVFDLGNEALAVYPIGKSWCLVCETSVEIRTHDFETILQKFGPMEIILENWWEDGVLHLTDLNGRAFAFSPRSETESLLDQVGGEELVGNA